MKKLKKLSQEDLDDISEYFSKIATDLILKDISSKEIADLDIDITVSYENSQLDVDIEVDISGDEFSNISKEDVESGISKAYSNLDSFIDINYRE
ncbi:MAG: DUF3194 domain-containing protein [Methanobrevibacter sp.]|nr:DUF3194 domain-containing protein [Methanobrevibacter sp.]